MGDVGAYIPFGSYYMDLHHTIEGGGKSTSEGRGWQSVSMKAFCFTNFSFLCCISSLLEWLKLWELQLARIQKGRPLSYTKEPRLKERQCKSAVS